MSNAVTYAFRQFGRGEGDVPIAHTDMGKIIAYVTKAGEEVATKSCTIRGRYNVTQARDTKFILGIATTIPYAEVLRELRVKAVDIPEKLKEFIDNNHTYESGKGLPKTFIREWDNLLLAVRMGSYMQADILPEKSLAYENCKAVTAVILRAAVREEVDGEKTVIKQSELTEPVVAGAEEYVFSIVKDELDDIEVERRLMERI